MYRKHLKKVFHYINNLHQNIQFTKEEKSNGDLAFLDTLLKWNNENNGNGICEAYAF